jgi:hypothetical protein
MFANNNKVFYKFYNQTGMNEAFYQNLYEKPNENNKKMVSLTRVKKVKLNFL